LKMIEQAKAAIESEKKCSYGWIETGFYCRWVSEKLLKDELSNKEAQTKLVEKMLGDVKLN
jgi:F-type H+-transporting ATPase subunit b